MGFWSIKPKKQKPYEKLYRVKVEPVEETEKVNANEVVVKDKD